MESWQREHISENLDKLVINTRCTTLFLAHLSPYLGNDDKALLASKGYSHGDLEQSKLLYDIAVTKVGMYNVLMKALDEERQTGAYKILMEGVLKQGTWNDRRDTQKAEIHNQLVNYQGITIKLRDIVDLNELGDDEKLHDMTNGKTPTLVNNQVPLNLSYYIPRAIKTRTKLKSGIFQTKCNDVFVVQGVERKELTILANGCETDISRNQIRIRKLTVRFILLEFEPDFEQICDRAEAPVHWIKVYNKTYNWVKSSGSLEILNDFINESQDSLSVEQMAIRREKVILSDSPGMGKTILLAKIAQEIMQKEPLTLVRFIVLKEFVQALHKKEISINSIAFLIAQQSSTFELGQKLVEKAVKTGKCIFMFDGFDEVLPNQVNTARKILKKLGGLESTRIFVTTRPHMRNILENALQVLGHTIEPFSDSHQVSFLLKYWESKGISEHSSVEQFARSCLNALTLNMTEFECKIAEIPLQCKLLAETYIDEAKRCSLLGFQTYQYPHSVPLMTSVFEMYETHMNMQFKNAEVCDNSSWFGMRWIRSLLRKSQCDKIKHVHMYHALQLLFPHETNLFRPLTSDSGWKVSVNDLYKFGILEVTHSNSLRFVHRTFAEYFVAWFVTEMHKDLIPNLADFTLSQIFSTKKSTRIMFRNLSSFGDTPLEIQSYNFNFPVVCYFINEFINRKFRHKFNSSRIPALLNSTLHSELLPAFSASAFHNYAYVPWVVSKLVGTRQICKSSQDTNIHDLLLTTAKYSDVELMKAFQTQRDIPRIGFTISEKAFIITPLHVAVQRGHYNIVEYLVNQYNSNIYSLPYLFHYCVEGSLEESSATLSSKKQIIQLLMTKSTQWLNEPLSSIRPILQSKVNLELLECLLHEGADVNVFDNEQETVLHKIGKKYVSPESYHKILLFLCKHGFKYFNLHNKEYEKTPLHFAIESIELLEETVHLLHSNGVDFNAVTSLKESVLFCAIRGGRFMSLIKLLVDCGAEVMSRNYRNDSVLHVCVECENFEALEYFVQNHTMDVNIIDEDGNTPLHLAVMEESEAHVKAQHLLITCGADANAKNSDFKTPLFESCCCDGLRLDIIQLMENHNLELNERICSDVLKTAICNRRIELAGKYANVFMYLIDKGGRFGSEDEWNPWKFMLIRKNMCHIVNDTDVTNEMLDQAMSRNLLSSTELGEILEMRDSLRSTCFYRIIKDVFGSFEYVLQLLIITKQLDVFNTIRECLRGHLIRLISPLPAYEAILQQGWEKVLRNLQGRR